MVSTFFELLAILGRILTMMRIWLPALMVFSTARLPSQTFLLGSNPVSREADEDTTAQTFYNLNYKTRCTLFVTDGILGYHRWNTWDVTAEVLVNYSFKTLRR